MRLTIPFAVISLLLAACGTPPEPKNTSNGTPRQAIGNAANTVSANIQNPPAGNAAGRPPTETGAEPKTFTFPEKDGPAPDDSDIKSALGENFVQTRTFHSHPQIAKVEKTTVMGNEPKSTVKVYLKNGQVKEIHLENALTAPAADILKAIH